MTDTAASGGGSGVGSVVYADSRPYLVIGNDHGGVTAVPLPAPVTFYTGEGKNPETGQDNDFGDYPHVREKLTDEKGEPHKLAKAPPAPKKES